MTSGICHFSVFVLFFRCLLIWVQVTAYRLRQQEALSFFRRVREHHLLVASFAEWRVKFLTAKQQVLREERDHEWQERAQAKACHRWRVASRGRQAFRLGSVAAVKQVREEGPNETIKNSLFSSEDYRGVVRH